MQVTFDRGNRDVEEKEVERGHEDACGTPLSLTECACASPTAYIDARLDAAQRRCLAAVRSGDADFALV